MSKSEGENMVPVVQITSGPLGVVELVEKTKKEEVVFLALGNDVVCVMLSPEKYEELYDLASIVLDYEALKEHTEFIRKIEAGDYDEFVGTDEIIDVLNKK